MELRQLHYLLAVAEEGNFTRAAEKVFISQSALSQQIQVLEKEVGALLVNRSKRGVGLTPAGEILCHYARRMVSELEQAQVALRELDGLQRGELIIGVVQTVNNYFLPSVIGSFSARYPAIKLHIEELSSDEIEAGLLNGTLQVGLGFIPATAGDLTAESLFEERLALVTRADHPLCQQSAVAVESLHEMPLIMLANTFCTRRLWEESARLVCAQPQVVMEMNTVSSILSVVLKTGLPTVLPDWTLIEARSDSLRTLPLHDPTPVRQVGLLWNQETYVCQASRAFMAVVREVAEMYQTTSPLAMA